MLIDSKNVAGLDNIVVFNANAQMIGASSYDTDIVHANQSFEGTKIEKIIRTIQNNPDDFISKTHTELVSLKQEDAIALGLSEAHPMVLLIASPIFDDFGDIISIILANRSIKVTETILQDFSKTANTDITIVVNNKVISFTGLNGNLPELSEKQNFVVTSDEKYWGRCMPFFTSNQICTFVEEKETHVLKDALIEIGSYQGRKLAFWLTIISIISIIVFSVILFIVSSHLIKPLNIAAIAVRNVAKGDWQTHVTGAERNDEIGEISKAIISLQKSLEERDKLKLDMANVEKIQKHRENVEEAITAFEREMRKIVYSISENVDHLEDTAEFLSEHTSTAEGEVAEASFITDMAMKNYKNFDETYVTLGVDPTHAPNFAAQVKEFEQNVLDQIPKATNSQSTDLHIERITTLMNEISILMLNVSVKVIEDDKKAISEYNLMSTLSVLMQGALYASEKQLLSLNEKRINNNDVIFSYIELGNYLEETLKHLFFIKIYIETMIDKEQKIDTNVSRICENTIAIAGSIGRLRKTIDDTCLYSRQIMDKAGSMADNARKMDVAVRTFIRKVV